MGTYLGRNVNLALLVIIIGVVVALVGTTVFFQRGLQNRTQDFEVTSSQLNACQTALTNYQQQYEETRQKLNDTAQDIKKYDELYEEKTGELKDAQSQIAKTQQQLAFEKLQKEKFQQFYEAELRNNQQLNSTVTSLRTQVNNLNNEIDDLESTISSCRSKLPNGVSC